MMSGTRRLDQRNRGAGSGGDRSGVRMALGASRANLCRLLVGEGLRLAAIGAAFGLVAGMAMAPLLSGVFIPLESTSPAAFATFGAMLLLVGVAGAYLPARRATSVQPACALPYE